MNASIRAAISDRLWAFRHRESLRWAEEMRADAEARRRRHQDATDWRWQRARRVRFYLRAGE